MTEMMNETDISNGSPPPVARVLVKTTSRLYQENSKNQLKGVIYMLELIPFKGNERDSIFVYVNWESKPQIRCYKIDDNHRIIEDQISLQRGIKHNGETFTVKIWDKTLERELGEGIIEVRDEKMYLKEWKTEKM